MIRYSRWLGAALLVSVAVGCSTQTTETPAAAQSKPSQEGQKFLLTTEPEGAQDVIVTRKDAEDDQEVTVIGRIGGSMDPWIKDRAAFSLVDRSLPACSDIPGDQCPTPWDYCCATDKLPAATALVKVVDGDGNLVATDARELLGLHELQTVVIKGKAHRDDSGNVTILASAIYPHEGDPGQFPKGSGVEHAHHDHDHDHAHDHAEGDDHDHDHAHADDHDDDSAAMSGDEADHATDEKQEK